MNNTMRYLGSVTLLATAAILGACSKGEQQQGANSPVATPPAPPPAAPPATSAVPAPTSTPPTVPSPHPVVAAHDSAPTTHHHHTGAAQASVKSIGALKYVDVKIGTGDIAKPGMQVKVLYKGQLLNGTTFDSTADRDNPFVFQLGAGRVIQGWDMGINGMRVGGKRHLIIPPELGYGSQANDPIPPNSTLVFDVELLSVEPAA